MATYTIVSTTKTPLDPGEINAGGTITVAEGDVFVIDPGADSNTTFDDGGGGPFNFDVQINASNSNNLTLKFQSGVNPSVDIADGADLSIVNLDAQTADSLTVTIGDNVTLGTLKGSAAADTITIGDGFTATGDWNLLGGNDALTVGLNADFTASNLKGGLGDDTLTFGDGTAFGEIDAEDGADTLYFGDNVTGSKIKGGDGDDFIQIGANANITGNVDGGGGSDTMNTQTTGLSESSIESTSVVCFASGTRIATPDGEVEVQDLVPGQLVATLEHGAQPLRWLGHIELSGETLAREPRLRPIGMDPGALAKGVPRRRLLVSPQHRVLVQSPVAARMFRSREILVAAKKLLGVEGITAIDRPEGMTYCHLLFDRHEIVSAEGAWAESLFLGPETHRVLDDDDLNEIALVLAGADTALPQHRLARLSPTNQQRLQTLVARHMKNRKPIQIAAAFV